MLPKFVDAFCRNQSGNFAVTFAVSAFAIFGIAGSAIDYSRLVESRSAAQDVADSMVLATTTALAAGKSELAAKREGMDFFDSNFSHLSKEGGYIGEVDIDREGQKYSIRANISGNVDASLLKVAGFRSFPYNVSATSGYSINNIEVAFALDVSVSMTNSPDKMQAMQRAVSQLIDRLDLQQSGNVYRRASIIPYGESVNFGMAREDWLADYVGHGHGHGSGSSSSSGGPNDFAGCFRPEPYRQYENRGLASVKPGRYETLVNLQFSGVPLCPRAESEAVFFEHDADLLKARVEGLTPAFGTATDIGLAWAWRTFNRNWRIQIRKGYDDVTFADTVHRANMQKVIILLTDGMIVRFTPEGDGNHDLEKDEPLETMQNICSEIRKDGDIAVFVVGYELDVTADSWGKKFSKTLKNCTGEGGRYYNAGVGNVEAIFDHIGVEISKIYISS